MWYTTVTFGWTDGYRRPPHGPWKTREDAEAAMQRWRDAIGCMAGTLEAAHSVRIYGPYATRAEARDADISEHP